MFTFEEYQYTQWIDDRDKQAMEFFSKSTARPERFFFVDQNHIFYIFVDLFDH
jgi:hypothetical protein